jgi:hypothetical protein
MLRNRQQRHSRERGRQRHPKLKPSFIKRYGKEIAMNRLNKLLKDFTLVEIVITLVSLTIAALAGVVDNIYLAYFWYLALLGIGVILFTSVFAACVLLTNRCVRWYRHQLQAWDGVHPAGV